jgi:serine phosphatase RsbU (regulator of sigma subunit)
MPDVQLLRASGDLLALRSRNLPLAIAPELELECEQLTVEPGERVFAVSDGVVECQSPQGQMFGTERLREVLLGGPPEGAFTALLEAMKSFSDGLQSDDVSILEVRV